MIFLAIIGGVIVLVLILVITALAQPPTRWVDYYTGGKTGEASGPENKNSPPPFE